MLFLFCDKLRILLTFETDCSSAGGPGNSDEMEVFLISTKSTPSKTDSLSLHIADSSALPAPQVQSLGSIPDRTLQSQSHFSEITGPSYVVAHMFGTNPIWFFFTPSHEHKTNCRHTRFMSSQNIDQCGLWWLKCRNVNRKRKRPITVPPSFVTLRSNQ